jgi:hypothetical protein
MRSSVFFAVVALAALSGCNGGQPRIYNVAVDITPLRTIADPSCYKNSQLPSGDQITEVNYRSHHQWVIWDSGDGKQYLDVGQVQFKLGDSPTISVADMIETSQAGTFQGSRNETNTAPGNGGSMVNETRQTSVTVTFNDEGAAPTGNVQLRAQYACVGNCFQPNPTPDSVSCATQLSFEARRIDTSRIEAYSPVGQ